MSVPFLQCNTLQLRHETPSSEAKYQTWNLWHNLLWITEAKEDVGKCRGGDTETENRGEGPPTGEPQGRTACRGATGERGEEGARGKWKGRRRRVERKASKEGGPKLDGGQKQQPDHPTEGGAGS
jgi:hypothetical protein